MQGDASMPNAKDDTRPNRELPEDNRSPRGGWGMGAVALVFVCVAAATLAYSYRQRQQIDEMALTNQSLGASITQLQNEIQSLTERLDRARETDQAREKSSSGNGGGASASDARPRRRPSGAAAADSQLSQLRNQLSDQRKELAGTRDDLTKTREDLEGKLDSTRDELSGSVSRTRDQLSGSIARTHDELENLQKRGERNYYEFSADKSKQFQRVGPVSLSLRKVDFKHKSYDLALFVDDFQMQKKGVNLYEPVWIRLIDQPDPVELVVNRIDKNKIQGYISAPKYKKSDLGATASTAAPADGEPLP